MSKPFFGNLFKSSKEDAALIESVLKGEKEYESCLDKLGLEDIVNTPSFHANKSCPKKNFTEAQIKIIKGNPSIFVSSTFVDMQRERDVLHYKVLPELKKFAGKYKQSIGFTDLRWGINTEDMDEAESGRKIIEVCNREIDKSKPYMLVLIGDRYGWIPGKDEKSVTEMEIEYGVFSCPENRDKTLFLMRNLKETDNSKCSEKYLNESPKAKESLDKLKRRIRKDFPDRIIDYDAVIKDGKIEFDEDLIVSKVTERIEEMLESDFGSISSMSDYEKSYYRWLNVLENSNDKYADVFSKIGEIKERAKDGTILQFIMAEEGEGGTTSLLLSCLSMQEEYRVYGYIPELGIGQMGPYSMLKQLIWYAEDALELEHVYEDLNINELRSKLGSLLKQIDEKEMPVAFFIDSPSKLEADMAQFETVDERSLEQGEYKLPDCSNVANWMPSYIPTCVRFIIADSYLSFPYSYKKKRKGKDLFGSISLDKLDGDQQAIIARSYLSAQGKELSENVVRAFKNATPKTPLHTKLGCIGLMNLGEDDFEKIRLDGRGMDSLSEYMTSYVNDMCDTEENESWRVMTRVANRINPALIEHFLLPQALGFYGYRIKDIIEISEGKVSELDVINILETLSEFFICDENGFYKYKYEKMKNLNRCRELLGADCIKRFYERSLIYQRTLEWEDIFKINDYQTRLLVMFLGGDSSVVPEFICNIHELEKIRDQGKKKWALYRSATALWVGVICTRKKEDFVDAMYETLRKKTVSEVSNPKEGLKEYYKKESFEDELYSFMRFVRIYVNLIFTSGAQNPYFDTMFEFVGILTELMEESYREHAMFLMSFLDENTNRAISMIKKYSICEKGTLEMAMCEFEMAVMAINTKWASDRDAYLISARKGMELLVGAFPENREYLENLAGIYEWIGFYGKNSGRQTDDLFKNSLDLFKLASKISSGNEKLSALRGIAIEANYIGDNLKEKGNYKEAAASYNLSLETAAGILRQKRSQFAYSDVCVALKKLAYTAINQKEYSKCGSLVRDGILIAEAGLVEFPGDQLIKNLALLYECAGFMFTKMGERDRSVEYFEKCINTYQHYEDITDPEYQANIELAKGNLMLAKEGRLSYS